MDILRTRIITAARSYLGTSFVHQGRGRHGLDCLGLLICVASDCSLYDNTGAALTSYDNVTYSRTPDTQLLQSTLNKVLQRHNNALMPGDIVLCNYQGLPQHLAIIGQIDNDHTLIHAYAPVGKVVEHRLDPRWRKRIVAHYSTIH